MRYIEEEEKIEGESDSPQRYPCVWCVFCDRPWINNEIGTCFQPLAMITSIHWSALIEYIALEISPLSDIGHTYLLHDEPLPSVIGRLIVQ